MAEAYQLGPGRKALNVVMSQLLRLGLGGASMYLLTTTGRKSHQRRTTPVILVEEKGGGGDRWLVSPYGDVGWVHNVRADSQVWIRRGRTTQALQAQEVGPDVAGGVLRRYVRQASTTAPFFDAQGDDPVDSFVAEAGRHPVFRLTAPAAA